MPRTAPADRWLTLAEVADQEGVEPRTIRARVGRGAFPAPARFHRKDEPQWSAKDIAAAGAADPRDEQRLPRAERIEANRAQAVERLLDEVRWWVWEHGDATVPSRALGRVRDGRPYRIGAQVTATRSAYRHGRLSAREAAAFEALPGWTWDHVHDTWRAHLDDVLTRWPLLLTSEDRRWLALQRGKFERLPKERQALLEAVPGLLEYKGNRRVDQFIEAVTRWLSENPGKTTYSIGYRDEVKVRGQVVQVGRKVTYYRRRYAGLEGRRPLAAAEIARIEALPGWTWSMSQRHVEASAHRRKARAAGKGAA